MDTMIKCWKHFKTIIRHKWFVFVECCKMGIPWQGIVHDLSKFSLAEFLPSAKYFQGNRSPIEAEKIEKEYSYAWLHHKGVNRHHWQWYIDNDGVDENGIIKWYPAPMPDKYIKEMYCDMVGAGKAYGGAIPIKDYYLSKRHEWLLHPETKIKFERMLGIE
jgi:hypothetical protein